MMTAYILILFIHRYNKETDKLEPSTTVFYKSELNTIGMIIY